MIKDPEIKDIDHQLTDIARGMTLFENYIHELPIDSFAHYVSRPHFDTVWQRGSSCAHISRKLPQPAKDCKKDTAPVVLVPSLLNSEDIFSLSSPRIPNHHGFDHQLNTIKDVYILCWGEPAENERGYGLFEYAWRLGELLLWVAQHHGQPAHVLGYCLGGTIATLCAKLLPSMTGSLTLLASPWDFHQTQHAPLIGRALWQYLAQYDYHIVTRSMVAQSLQMLNPWRTLQRYATIAQCKNPQQLRHTLRLHQWACGCVDITTQLAKDIAHCYWKNTLLHYFDQGSLSSPLEVSALLVIPQRDELVPPLSSMALGSVMKHTQILSLATGHIGAIINPEFNRQFVDRLSIFWQTVER